MDPQTLALMSMQMPHALHGFLIQLCDLILAISTHCFGVLDHDHSLSNLLSVVIIDASQSSVL